MKIYNKLIPSALIKTLSSNWKARIDTAKWESVFPEKVVDPILYTLAEIERETRYVIEDYNRQVLESGTTEEGVFFENKMTEIFWFGRFEAAVKPGFVDGTQLVIIGEIGLERVFGLYYLYSEEPSIVYLNNDLLWIEISPNIESFIESVGLFY